MAGKFLAIVLLLSAVLAGGSLYYLQVYGFYEELPAQEVTLVSRATQTPESIAIRNFRGIDAASSPIRYRACFETDLSHAMLRDSYVLLEDATPRNAPGWFDCFDAAALGGEIDAGTALPFLAAKNVHYGVDRIVAITDDGRGYVWHELNDCGEKAYDGTVVGEECPPLQGQNTDQD